MSIPTLCTKWIYISEYRKSGPMPYVSGISICGFYMELPHNLYGAHKTSNIAQACGSLHNLKTVFNSYINQDKPNGSSWFAFN